jgi:hypothetical protein
MSVNLSPLSYKFSLRSSSASSLCNTRFGQKTQAYPGWTFTNRQCLDRRFEEPAVIRAQGSAWANKRNEAA